MSSLIPADIQGKIPGLYKTEETKIPDKIAHIRLADTGSNWQWYVIEFDGNDICWGLVWGHEVEYGYFSLTEMEEINKSLPRIQRDEGFKPSSVSAILQGMSEGV